MCLKKKIIIKKQHRTPAYAWETPWTISPHCFWSTLFHTVFCFPCSTPYISGRYITYLIHWIRRDGSMESTKMCRIWCTPGSGMGEKSSELWSRSLDALHPKFGRKLWLVLPASSAHHVVQCGFRMHQV